VTAANPASTVQDSALAAVIKMREQFQQTPLASVEVELLKAWRPKRSLWQRLLPLFTRQAGLNSKVSYVDDHRLHYWAGGCATGPVVVLLHGFGSSKENWVFVARKLAKTYRLLVPDIPGFGQSDFLVNADYQLAGQADRLALWLAALNIEHAYVVGSSMGGAIAAQIAARYPNLVSKLCLMNAAGVPGKHLTQMESGLAAGVNYLAPMQAKDAWQVFAIALHPQRRWFGFGLALLMGGAMSHRKTLNDYLFGELVESLADTYLQLPFIAAPTLVLWGDSDQVLDVSCADHFCESITDASAMILPAVGHLPMLEVPGLTARVLLDFWRAH
jgi:abhydrolase domain-containing protein 6